MIEDRFMKARDLAEYRSESVRSAQRFMRSGKVPVYREAGSLPRVLKSEVDAYMQSCRLEPVEQKKDLGSFLDDIAAKVRQQRKKAGAA